MWFIYLLPIFFVVAKLTRCVLPLVLWPLATLLEITDVHTDIVVTDEFCARYVCFYTGYAFAGSSFKFAETVRDSPREGLTLLFAWAVFEVQVVMSAGVATLLIFHRAVRHTALRFLIVRPAGAKLKPQAPIVRAETA